MAELSPGVELREIERDGASFRVVTVDLTRARLELVGQAPGDPHRAKDLLADPPPGLVAATNAGLYHSADDPVGLFVQDGVERSPLELGDGRGNFFLRPNGVFYVDAEGAHVVASEAWTPRTATLATQSGPALLLGGALHPKLDPQSESKKIRNAVGVSGPSTVQLVLSTEPVRFYTLATLLRDDLGCTDALFLDGSISGLWGPGLPPWPVNETFAGFLVVRSKD